MGVLAAFQTGVYPWDRIGKEHPLYRPDLSPGASEWAEDDDGVAVALHFVCPCGCSKVQGVQVYMGDIGYGWKWDCDRERPTLTPSISFAIPGGCGWHGHLVSGIFIPVS